MLILILHKACAYNRITLTSHITQNHLHLSAVGLIQTATAITHDAFQP
jgi:hypothetical protein